MRRHTTQAHIVPTERKTDRARPSFSSSGGCCCCCWFFFFVVVIVIILLGFMYQTPASSSSAAAAASTAAASTASSSLSGWAPLPASWLLLCLVLLLLLQAAVGLVLLMLPSTTDGFLSITLLPPQHDGSCWHGLLLPPPSEQEEQEPRVEGVGGAVVGGGACRGKRMRGCTSKLVKMALELGESGSVTSKIRPTSRPVNSRSKFSAPAPTAAPPLALQGLMGGGYLRASTSGQLRPLKNAWRCTCAASPLPPDTAHHHTKQARRKGGRLSDPCQPASVTVLVVLVL